VVTRQLQVERRIEKVRRPPKTDVLPLYHASFGAFWQIVLQLNCLSYTHKSVSLDSGL